MSANPIQNQQKIWYHPISKKDYEKIGQIGTVTVIVRFLPGFNDQGLYEALFEKNTAVSNYPDTKRWMVPVLVLNDPLHPEFNGFVGVTEMGKTLYQRIKNNNTPPSYFDFNTGHNFHINVSLTKGNDGTSIFPDYRKSSFEQQASQCNVNYVVPKMKEGKFSDFATFMNRLNNPKPTTPQGGYATIPPPPVGPVQATSVQPVTTAPVSAQPWQTQPVQVVQATPVVQAQAAPAYMTQPTQGNTQPPTNQDNPEEFDAIFGQQ